MHDLGISVNLNLAACWLKLCVFELAFQHCDLALKFDLSHVKARFRRARSLLGLGKLADARNDLCLALRYEPRNEDVLNELQKVETLYRSRGSKSSKDGPPIVRIPQLGHPPNPKTRKFLILLVSVPRHLMPLLASIICHLSPLCPQVVTLSIRWSRFQTRRILSVSPRKSHTFYVTMIQRLQS